MNNNSFFKTIVLSLNLIGITVVAVLQWKNITLKKRSIDSRHKIVSEFAQKWDKQTGRTFGERQDLDLNINAVALEVVVANLSQDNNTRYVTAYPVVKFAKGKLKKSDLAKALPKIREKFFEVINQKSAGDILESDGLTKLKDDLRRELNEINLPLEIEKIYFLSFVVS